MSRRRDDGEDAPEHAWPLDAPQKRAEGADPYRDGATFDPIRDALGGRPFLPDIVRAADLSKYATKQLEGRLRYFEKEAAGELNPSRRAEFKVQADRTRAELRYRANNPQAKARALERGSSNSRPPQTSADKE